MAQDVIILPYDQTAIPILESYGEQLAAVLVEPVQSRRPGYQPAELLRQLRTLTSAQGAVLIFDEIITGFRCHPAGAAGYFGVHPDLVTYGKVIGGGMPLGVIAGDAEFMAPIDGGRWRQGDAGLPQRPSMVFSGTFTKHPMAMAVAQHVIGHLRKESPRLQNTLTARTANLAAEINLHAAANGYPIDVEHFSSLFRININGSERAAERVLPGPAQPWRVRVGGAHVLPQRRARRRGPGPHLRGHRRHLGGDGRAGPVGGEPSDERPRNRAAVTVSRRAGTGHRPITGTWRRVTDRR